VNRQQLSTQFDAKFRAWRNHPSTVDWRKVDKNEQLAEPSAPDMFESMGMNIGEMYKTLEEDGRFGFLPSMASCAKRELGALNAESFYERCLSCANLIVTDGNTLLHDDEVKMLVILRMDYSFMEFMRANYSHIICMQQRFNITVAK